MNPVFFATAAELRAWFEEHHDQAQELWVGFYKKGSGRPSITMPEAVDEALCFGWIDSVRKSIDDVSYANRFTPRRPRSNWSAVNVRRVAELAEQGRMRPAGLAAFAARFGEKTANYSYEQESVALDDAAEAQFRANEKAWSFFQSRGAWYRRAAIWWVVSAKREETRRNRLAKLIEDSEHGRTLAHLTSPARRPRS